MAILPSEGLNMWLVGWWPKGLAARLGGLARGAAAACSVLAAAGPALGEVGPNSLTIAVGKIEGSGSEDIVNFGRAFDIMLSNDMGLLRENDPRFADCDVRIVEWNLRHLVQKELELQQSRFIDPASITIRAMPPEPKVMIDGTFALLEGSVRWSLVMSERATGKVLDTSEGSLPVERIIDASEIVAREFIEAACPKGWTISGGGARIAVTGHVGRIDAPFAASGAFPGGTATFSYTPTSAEGGTVSYILVGGGFSGAGEGSYTIAAGADGTYVIEQTTKGCMTGIPNSCKTNSETLVLTPDVQ